MTELIASATGGYVLAAAFAVGVGLMSCTEGVLIRISRRLIITVFSLLVLAHVPQAPLIGVIFTLVAALTSVLVLAHTLRERPLLIGEPYWRRVVLLIFRRRAAKQLYREPE